jgi:predicted transcriptional regulator
MSPSELVRYGTMATSIRKSVSELADSFRNRKNVNDSGKDDDAVISGIQLNRDIEGKKHRMLAKRDLAKVVGPEFSCKRKTRSRPELMSQELDNIVKTVREKKYTYKQAGKLLNVSSNLVQSVMSGTRNKPRFLEKAHEKEERRRSKLRAVIDVSTAQLESKDGLIKAESVKLAVGVERNINVSNNYVRKVMHCDLGLRYKTIKRVPYLGNTARAKLLRQMYAKFMLPELLSGKRVVNID